MDCREAQLLIPTYLDGEVSSSKESYLVEHLAGCVTCAHKLALQERISSSLRQLGQEAEQAPPELCRAVMDELESKSRSIFTRLPLTWRQAVAAAAAFLILAGGSAGVSAGLKMAGTGKMLGFHNSAQVNTNDGDTAVPDSPDPAPGSGEATSIPANEAGSMEEDPAPLTAPGSKPNAPNNSGDAVNANPPASVTEATIDGPKVLLRSGMEIVTTTLRTASEDPAADGVRAVTLAAEMGAKAQTFSEQGADNAVLILRITVAANQAHNLIAGLGPVNERQDESRDITDIFNDTLVKYHDLQTRICTSVDADELQQMEAQAVSYKQQLDAWEAEAGKRIIILILNKS